MNSQGQARGFLARMINPATLIVAVRKGVGGRDGGTSLFFLFVGILGLFATLPAYITYDLLSTWNFFQGVRYDTGSQAEVISSFFASTTQSIGFGAFIGSLVGWGITLFPTILELAAPSIDHPGVQLLNHLSCGFDFITDWPLSWAKAGEWTSVWPVRVFVAFVFNIIVSLGLQVLVVMFVTVIVISIMNIIGFGGQAGFRGQQSVIDVN